MMVTTTEIISDWFDRGVKKNYQYMVVMCDTFDWDDYPLYFNSLEEVKNKYDNPGSMQKVMESYTLTNNKDAQLKKMRSHIYSLDFM